MTIIETTWCQQAAPGNCGEVAGGLTELQAMGGRIFVFEGLDQSGKKTQVELLRRRLLREGFPCVKMSFPDYRTRIGREIKAFLEGQRGYSAQVRHMLLAANRWERKDAIELYLSQGKTILLDRYSQSNLAYGVAAGLDLNWLLSLEQGLPEADLVFVIDVSPATSFRRKMTKRDIHERDLRYLAVVKEAYLKLTERFGWVAVNGERPARAIHEEIWLNVAERLRKQ